MQAHAPPHVDTLRAAHRAKDDRRLAASSFRNADADARFEQILCVSLGDTRLNFFSLRHFARIGASIKGSDEMFPSASTSTVEFRSAWPKTLTSRMSPGPTR